MLMILKITIGLFILVAFNFLLLIFSCTKNEKTQKTAKKEPIRIGSAITTNLQGQEQLAPTGS